MDRNHGTARVLTAVSSGSRPYILRAIERERVEFNADPFGLHGTIEVESDPFGLHAPREISPTLRGLRGGEDCGA